MHQPSPAMLRILRLSAVLALLAGGTACAQTQRTVQPAPVVRVTAPGAVNPNEVSVSINPADPDHVVAVAMQFGRQPRVSNYAYVSDDGGRTWTTVPHPNPEGRTQGDDAVTFGADGIAYHSYISFDGLREERPARARNGIFVATSADGGRTWQAPVPAVDHLNTVVPFEDKPWLVTDDSPASPHRGHLYLAWTRFDVYGSADPADSTHIFFTRSDDGGRTFAMPFRISDRGGDCLDGDNTVEGAVPAAGPGGEVYVVWAGPLGLVFDRSDDGGWTFGDDRVIADMPGGWDIDIEGIGRHNGMPVTGVDLSDGPGRGTLYVNWIDQRHGDPDVFVMASRDGGATWSAPVRVNDDPVGNGKAQFFTWMAVDPVDGSVNVAFYDRRAHDGTQTAVTLARSTDGGRTFVNHPVGLPPFTPNAEVFFGDYLGIDAYGGRVVAVFPHFTGETELALSAALLRFAPGTHAPAR
jgi:hypothetical protein